MATDIKEEKSYSHDSTAVFTAAVGAVSGLEGEVKKEDQAAGQLEAKFNKKILGKTLGDRTEIQVSITSAGDKSTVSVTIYPIDPVGRKMMFGARKGVTRTVLDWYWAHLEHRLPK